MIDSIAEAWPIQPWGTSLYLAVRFDFDDWASALVSNDRNRRRICLELESHLEIAVLEESIKRVCVDVLTDEPLLSDHVLIVSLCNRLYEFRAKLFALGWLVIESR
nr:hypothetical protein [Halanaeroarchaeum sp. HSR-CO]